MENDQPRTHISSDKWRHAWMGMALALLAPVLCWWSGGWPERAWVAGAAGLGIATFAGLLKEIYDHYFKGAGKDFDAVDWLFTIGGGLAGALLIGAVGWLVERNLGLSTFLAFSFFAVGMGVGLNIVRRHGL